jgi:hypothetical protein
VERNVLDPPDAFEVWLRHRLAEAVEGREISADLLTELHGVLAEIRARPPEARDALALMELAERVHLPVDHLTELLVILRAQPTAGRERFLRRFVEAWLMRLRESYDADRHGGNDG